MLDAVADEHGPYIATMGREPGLFAVPRSVLRVHIVVVILHHSHALPGDLEETRGV